MHVRKMGEARSPFNGRTRETDSDFQGFRLDVITGKKCCFEIVRETKRIFVMEE